MILWHISLPLSDLSLSLSQEKMRPSTDHGDGETQVPDVAVETQPNHQSDVDREN